MPPAIAAWNAASERPATQRGAESCTPILNSATASIHTAPASTSAIAVRMALVLSATAAIAPAIDIVQARTAASPLNSPADRADVQRADHGAHAEGAQHDAVGLRAAMQEVARDQRHQRRDRAADDAGDQRTGQHDPDRRRVGDVAHAGDHRAVEPLARQPRRFVDPVPQKQHDQQRQIEHRIGGERRHRARVATMMPPIAGPKLRAML